VPKLDIEIKCSRLTTLHTKIRKVLAYRYSFIFHPVLFSKIVLIFFKIHDKKYYLHAGLPTKNGIVKTTQNSKNLKLAFWFLLSIEYFDGLLSD